MTKPEAVIQISGWVYDSTTAGKPKFTEEEVYVDRVELNDWVDGAVHWDADVFLKTYYPEAIEAFEEIETITVTNWGY